MAHRQSLGKTPSTPATPARKKTATFQSPDHSEIEDDRGDQLDLSDIRVRFGLRKREVDVLKVFISHGERDCDGWHYRGSLADITQAAGCAEKTARRAIAKLYDTGLVVSRGWRRGTPKPYRVRLEVITGEVTFADDSPRQKPLTAVTPKGDRGHPDPGHPEAAESSPESSSCAGTSRAAGPEGPIERERENNSLSHSTGGAGGTEVTPLPDLPQAAHDRQLSDRDLSAALVAWADQHGLQDVDRILAAVLAARRSDAVDADAYVGVCLRRGLKDHWLRRARRIINQPEVTRDNRNHTRADHNPARIRTGSSKWNNIEAEEL